MTSVDSVSPASVGLQAERWSAERIGALVAEYRRLRNIRVSELARSAGVSPSLISQIERGQSRPSVPTLFGLAEALDVSVDVFAGRDVRSGATPPAGVVDDAFMTEAALGVGAGGRYLVRKADRMSIAIAGGVRWELLTPQALDRLEFLELVYEPHAESNATLYRHPGVEMVVVLEGQFHINIGFNCFELSEGDSISFPSSLPHRYVNPSDTVARAVTVILRDEPKLALGSVPSESGGAVRAANDGSERTGEP
jgi:transcriptional regulator with XRE-family HTH domain